MPRPRLRFSLLTVLLLTTIVGMAIVLVVQWRELGPLRAEVRRLRDEVGYLTIDDDTRPHAIQIDTGEPNHWRWRVYIPAQGKYGLHTRRDHIPQRGLPTGSGSGGWSLLEAGEHRLDLWLKPDRTNGDRLMGRLQVSNGGNSTFTLLERDHDWIFNEETGNSSYGWSGIGEGTRSFPPDRPFELFRLRADDIEILGRDAEGNVNSWSNKTIEEPCEGLMIWIDQQQP